MCPVKSPCDPLGRGVHGTISHPWEERSPVLRGLGRGEGGGIRETDANDVISLTGQLSLENSHLHRHPGAWGLRAARAPGPNS